MWFDNLLTFIELGFRHILPLGPDHILFVVAIYLNSQKWTSLLLQVSCFTVAHTLTLGAAAAGWVDISPDIVEPLIALSIAAVAIEAFFFDGAQPWRLPVVFAFGLFHGLGFASQIHQYMAGADFVTALLGFNVGVELGQLTVLAATAVIFMGLKIGFRQAGREPLYRNASIRPAAAIIAAIGVFWFLQRVGVVGGIA